MSPFLFLLSKNFSAYTFAKDIHRQFMMVWLLCIFFSVGGILLGGQLSLQLHFPHAMAIGNHLLHCQDQGS